MTDNANPPPPPPAAWHAGLEPEILGHIQNRGWDKLEAPAATKEAIKAFREAEKMIGAPPNEILRLPKDPADQAGWNQVYSRLGRPQDAKGYDFSNIKRAGDQPLDQATVDALSAAAFESGLSKDAASRVVSALVKHQDSSAQAAGVEAQAALAIEKDTLTKNWGTNYNANMVVAQRAAAALGVTPDAVAALEKVAGYSKVMDMFRQIGARIGEDKFVSSNNIAGGVMTRDQAIATKNERMADKAWTDRYLAGGASEKREMEALTRIIVGA